MTSTPTREQLAFAIGALSSEAIQARLDSGQLTELGRSVAREELARRKREGEPELEPLDPQVVQHDDASLDEFLQHPLGWSWGRWLAVGAVCCLVVMMFGTTAKNKADQSFLWGVILVQGFLLAGILRVATSLLSSSSVTGALGKLVAVGALCVVVFGLVLCSSIAQTGLHLD